MADRHKRWIDDEDDCIIVSSNTLPKKRRVEESQDSQQNADHKRWIDDEDDCIIVSSNTLPQKRRVEESQDSQQKADHDYHDEQALDDDQIEESNDSQIDDQTKSGIILQIQLINFMCHSNLSMTLGGNVNIIIGRNGSGKSAIMTGIIICLSGRPSITNRASSLKEFIKKDAKYARIVITLANNGSDAYRAVDFGPNIFLERHIWNDGHSTCKLKSTNGRIIANDKKELQNILEHYNIQIDNPACFLTQDASREFLESQNEAKKYQFFLKAIQQKYNNFICASDTQQYSLAAVNKKEKIIEEQKQVVEHHRSRLRFLDHLDKIENDLRQLKVSLAWANVRIEEEKLQQFKDAVTQIEKGLAKAEQRLNTINENEEKLSESRKDVELEITKLTDKLHNLQVKKASLDTEKKSYQDEKLSCNRKYQAVKYSINHAENDRDMLQKKIDEIMERDEGTQARLTRESKITSLKEELDRLQSTLSKATDSKVQLEYSRKKEETDLQELRPKIFFNEKTKRNLEDEIKRLEASSQNRLEVYGHYMPELVRRVQEAHQRRRFHKFPLGPLGQNVTLKDQKWAVAIENCLGDLLRSFHCHDHHDKDILIDICRLMRIPRMPTVVVSKFLDKPHDIPKFRCRYPTVLESLDINNSNVINCFIDQKGIENILLIEHREEAINFLTGRNVPGNVREAYIINGDHLYGGANFRYYSNFRRGVHYFVRNVTEEIRRRKSLFENCNNDIRNASAQMTSIQRNLDKIKTDYNSIRQSISYHQDRMNSLKNEIQELQSFEVKASDLTALETELHDREEEIEKDKEELEKLVVSYRNVATKATTLEDQINDLENGIQKIVEDMKLLKEKRKEIEVKYRSYDSQWNELQSKIDQWYRKKNEKLQTISYQENTVETSKEAAFKLSPTRCNSSLDISTLNKQIKAKKKRLSDHEKETGTREEILAAYGIAKKKYNEQSGHLTILDSTSKQLNNQLKKRHKLFTGMQKILTQRIITTFGKTLAKRGYLGTMLIDHNKKKISLDVKISANAKTSGTGSLSGGERSFSTVAFIVALWEATDSPLQCLDEFDVFMDMVNRDLCMDTLLQLATTRKLRQFIFLSPQNMSKLKFKENIRIHRLQDPARENNQPPITDSLVRQS